MSNAIVKVDNVSKKFAASLKRGMIYGMADIARAALIPQRFRSKGLATRIQEKAAEGRNVSVDVDQRKITAAPGGSPSTISDPSLRPTEFWAVKDVSFEIRKGECLGFIGHNGAGKSTLFKLLSGIYGPTSGHIEMHGSLSALIEVGSGFHPMLSGRENIYITGAIRGMSTAEIDRKYEQIVEFSGVQEFIDMPVKFYSSGMHVRLGFSVLAHLEPDILLIDEILAVGDLAFQRKCIEHVNKLRESDMALALISHSLYRIESLCHRVVWLDHGQVVMTGSSHEVVKAYREYETRKSLEESGRSSDDAQDDVVPVVVKSDSLTIHAVETRHSDGRLDDKFGYGEDIIVRIVYTAHVRIDKPRFNFDFTFNNVNIIEIGMLIDGRSPDFIEGPGSIECRIQRPRLLPKVYQIMFWAATTEGAVYLTDPSVVGQFAITASGIETLDASGPYAIGMLMTGGMVTVDYEWNLSKALQADALQFLTPADENS